MVTLPLAPQPPRIAPLNVPSTRGDRPTADAHAEPEYRQTQSVDRPKFSVARVIPGQQLWASSLREPPQHRDQETRSSSAGVKTSKVSLQRLSPLPSTRPSTDSEPNRPAGPPQRKLARPDQPPTALTARSVTTKGHSAVPQKGDLGKPPIKARKNWLAGIAGRITRRKDAARSPDVDPFIPRATTIPSTDAVARVQPLPVPATAHGSIKNQQAIRGAHSAIRPYAPVVSRQGEDRDTEKVSKWATILSRRQKQRRPSPVEKANLAPRAQNRAAANNDVVLASATKGPRLETVVRSTPDAPIILHPPQLTTTATGEPILEPQISVGEETILGNSPGPVVSQGVSDVFELSHGYFSPCGPCGPCGQPCPATYGNMELNPLISPMACKVHCLGSELCVPSPDKGVAREWLRHSPMFIDSAQPLMNHRLRFDAAWNHEFPDRSEFFWGRSPNGRGPDEAGVGEVGVDYQDVRFQMEIGGERFSVATELPLRFIDPVLNPNTGGLGDIVLSTKAVLCNGDTWQVTSLFRTYFNTGAVSHGTGTGHISMEPGILVRYAYSDLTYFHSEIKYWFPLGADPIHSGEVFRYGFGWSHVYHDGDAFGIIPLLEFVGWSVQDGEQTRPFGVLTDPVDGLDIFNMHPGVRFVFDTTTDWGVWDFGIGAGFALTDAHWYEGTLRMDLRWTY